MKLTLLLLLFINSAFAITGLEVGQKTPLESLKSTDGKEFDLNKGTKVLVFYRGSWCPYCVTQLKGIKAELQPKVAEKGIDILAISVDSETVSKKMKRNFKLPFNIVSDPKANTLKAFKIVNKVEDSLVKKYKNSYSIDIERDSGEKHHMIAHPGVFIIKEGKITFADVHENYKQRTENKIILKELGL